MFIFLSASLSQIAVREVTTNSSSTKTLLLESPSPDFCCARLVVLEVGALGAEGVQRLGGAAARPAGELGPGHGHGPLLFCG